MTCQPFVADGFLITRVELDHGTLYTSSLHGQDLGSFVAGHGAGSLFSLSILTLISNFRPSGGAMQHVSLSSRLALTQEAFTVGSAMERQPVVPTWLRPWLVDLDHFLPPHMAVWTNTTTYSRGTFRVKRDPPSTQVFYLLESRERNGITGHEWWQCVSTSPDTAMSPKPRIVLSLSQASSTLSDESGGDPTSVDISPASQCGQSMK